MPFDDELSSRVDRKDADAPVSSVASFRGRPRGGNRVSVSARRLRVAITFLAVGVRGLKALDKVTLECEAVSWSVASSGEGNRIRDEVPRFIPEPDGAVADDPAGCCLLVPIADARSSLSQRVVAKKNTVMVTKDSNVVVLQRLSPEVECDLAPEHDVIDPSDSRDAAERRLERYVALGDTGRPHKLEPLECLISHELGARSRVIDVHFNIDSRDQGSVRVAHSELEQLSRCARAVGSGDDNLGVE